MGTPRTTKPLKGRSWTARVVIVTVLSGPVSAGFTGLATSANAAAASYTTSSAACAGIEPGTYIGACITKPDGSQTWLGTYRDSANKEIFLCLDYLYASRLTAFSTSTTSRLINKYGTVVPGTSLRALAYAVSVYEPQGSSGSPITDAALAYIARLVMGDGYVSRTPLAIAQSVPNTSWGLPAVILAKARAIWGQAVTHIGGPSGYTTTLSGLPKTTGIGSTYRLTVTVTSSAQAVGGAHPLSGIHAAATVVGNLHLTGGTSAVTNRGGQATFTVTATGAGPGTASVRVTGLPLSVANIETPPGWHTNASSDTVPQRGFIALTGAAATRATSRTLTAAETASKYTPTATVATSTHAITLPAPKAGSPAPTTSLHATFTIGNWPTSTPPSTSTATATLWGPYPKVPTTCPPSTGRPAASSAGSVTVVVNGDGTYTTPTLTLSKPGYYTWTLTLSDTANINRAASGCPNPGATSHITTATAPKPKPKPKPRPTPRPGLRPRPVYRPTYRTYYTYTYVPVPHSYTYYTTQTKTTHKKVRATGASCQSGGGWGGFFQAIVCWINTAVTTIVHIVHTWYYKTYTRHATAHQKRITNTCPPTPRLCNTNPLLPIYWNPPSAHPAPRPACHVVYVLRSGPVCVRSITARTPTYTGNGRTYRPGPKHNLGHELGLAGGLLWNDIAKPLGYAVAHPVKTVKTIATSIINDFKHCNIHHLMSASCGSALLDTASLIPIVGALKAVKAFKAIRDLEDAERAAQAARAARFAVDSSRGATMYLHVGSKSFEVTEHAAQRMVERGVSIDQAEGVLARTPIRYYHQGTWKVGYYDPKSGLFLGAANGRVTTVIAKASQAYINNLRRARP